MSFIEFRVSAFDLVERKGRWGGGWWREGGESGSWGGMQRNNQWSAGGRKWHLYVAWELVFMERLADLGFSGAGECHQHVT